MIYDNINVEDDVILIFLDVPSSLALGYPDLATICCCLICYELCASAAEPGTRNWELLK